jgi:hypothetical protein
MAPIDDALAAIKGEKKPDYSFIAKNSKSTEELLYDVIKESQSHKINFIKIRNYSVLNKPNFLLIILRTLLVKDFLLHQQWSVNL